MDLQDRMGCGFAIPYWRSNLFNRATGKELLVAEASPDAVGQLVAPNEIVFKNAFTGSRRIEDSQWEGRGPCDVLLTRGWI